jgi:hypothetical protein
VSDHDAAASQARAAARPPTEVSATSGFHARRRPDVDANVIARRHLTMHRSGAAEMIGGMRLGIADHLGWAVAITA